MPKPRREPKAHNKMRDWVEKNPERWYTARYGDIHIETDVSFSTLYRYFPLIVAEFAQILPSEVKAKREEHGGTMPFRRELSDEEIAEIHQLYDEGKSILDIAFMTGWSLVQIAKHKPNKKPRRKANREAD